MFSRGSVVFTITATAVSIVATSGPIRAAEAYVCGPDHIVYVEVEDLERMKRTDACIAGFYGLTVDKDATPSSGEALATPSAQEPRTSIDAPALRGASETDTTIARSDDAHRVASAEPVRAASNTDFRNVRVLNAVSADGTWYRHTR